MKLILLLILTVYFAQSQNPQPIDSLPKIEKESSVIQSEEGLKEESGIKKTFSLFVTSITSFIQNIISFISKYIFSILGGLIAVFIIWLIVNDYLSKSRKINMLYDEVKKINREITEITEINKKINSLENAIQQTAQNPLIKNYITMVEELKKQIDETNKHFPERVKKVVEKLEEEKKKKNLINFLLMRLIIMHFFPRTKIYKGDL